MEIGVVKNPIEFDSSAYPAQTASGKQATAGMPKNGSENAANITKAGSDEANKDKDPVNQAEVQKMTAAMNRVVQAMDIKIQFQVHEKTNELMVQVVDQATQKVLKEFPSHEFLDTVAGIREYVGILLDKKI